MPKKLYKYTLQYGAETLDCEPVNWADFQVAVSREDHTLKRDFTTDLTFSGRASTLLQEAYNATSKGSIVTLLVERLNTADWSYIAFRTLRANFIGFSIEKGLSTLSFYEDTLRLSIENLKDIEYTLDVPQTRTIRYNGMDKVRNNTLSLINGECASIGTTTKRYVAQCTHQSEYSNSVTFLRPDGLERGTTRFEALRDCSITLKVHLGIMAMRCYIPYGGSNYTGGKMQVVKLRNGTFSIIDSFSATSYYAEKGGVRDTFDYPERTYNLSLLDGDEVFLAYLPFLGATSVVATGIDTLNTFMIVTDVSDSPYQDYRVTALTPYEVCSGILTKMGISATVTMPTINNFWDIYLTGKESLAQKSDAKLVTTWSDIIEFMYMLGYAVDYTDTSVVFSLITDNYQNIEADEVDILNGFSTTDDDTHVFSSVVVGYDTSDADIEEGEKDIMCKNTFTLNKNVDKKLEITTKYKASPYTIESAIKSAREDSSKTKSTDSDIFVFVVKKDDYEISYTSEANTYISNVLMLETLSGYTTYNVTLDPNYKYTISGFLDAGKIHLLYVRNGEGIAYEGVLNDTTFVDYELLVEADYVYIVNKDTVPFVINAIRKDAELYRERTSTTITETNYNEPITPMRILIRHGNYLGVSFVGMSTNMVFESTERSSDATIQLPYETEPLNENEATSSVLQSALNSPLFLPVIFRFKSAYNLQSMSDLFVNKYYKFLDKNTGIMHKGFIYSLSLQLAMLRECEFQMLSYDI